MEAIIGSDLKLDGIDGYVVIEDFDYCIKANEHSVSKLKLIVDNTAIKSICRKYSNKECFSICNTRDKNEVLFLGYIKTFTRNIVGDYVTAILELISCTIDLDEVKKSRSFQEVSSTYGDIIRIIEAGYNGVRFEVNFDDSDVIGYPIFQYQETDWEFLKRIAGMVGCGMLPVPIYRGPFISLGINKQRSIELSLKEYAYGFSNKYYELGAEEKGYSRGEFIYYNVKQYENYNIGDRIISEEKNNIICEKSCELKDSELIFDYKIGNEVITWQGVNYNEKLCGLSLKGTVSDVMEDRLKLKLGIDGDKGHGYYPFHWYPSTNNHMYCMPEIGEDVYLYISSSDAKEAKVITCARNNGETCAEVQDNKKKTFANKDKKMILGPNSITLSSSALQKLELLDGDMINLTTDKKLIINALNEVIADTKIFNMNSPQQIVVTDIDENGAAFSINGTIEIGGQEVMVRGQEVITFSPFNDAPVVIKKNWGKLALKFLAAVVVVAAVAAAAAAITILTGGLATAAIGAAIAVGVGAAIGGGICAAINVIAQLITDNNKGIKRHWSDYLYQGLDQFCTGAMLAAPMALPLPLVGKLTGVAFTSFAYQSIDSWLDNKFGSDFYDSDSNMALNIIFDVAFAGLGSSVSKGINSIFGKVWNKLTHLSKSDTRAIAQFLNKLPWITDKYDMSGSARNTIKKEFRKKGKQWVVKYSNAWWMKHIVLGGIDLPGTSASDTNLNPALKLITDKIKEAFSEEYDKSYDENTTYISFDEEGNLEFVN